MEKILENEASFIKSGASWYLLLPRHTREFIGIKETNEGNELITDAKLVMAIGKHGRFLYLYSPSQQREYKRKIKKQQEGSE